MNDTTIHKVLSAQLENQSTKSELAGTYTQNATSQSNKKSFLEVKGTKMVTGSREGDSKTAESGKLKKTSKCRNKIVEKFKASFY